jgi:hypothetical protein
LIEKAEAGGRKGRGLGDAGAAAISHRDWQTALTTDATVPRQVLFAADAEIDVSIGGCQAECATTWNQRMQKLVSDATCRPPELSELKDVFEPRDVISGVGFPNVVTRADIRLNARLHAQLKIPGSGLVGFHCTSLS